MFKVKICGVRSKDDIDAVAQHVDAAIGLNFYPPSVRYLDPTKSLAGDLSAAAETAGIVRVGVFVNESADMIDDVCERVGLNAAQLHGDEPVDLVRELSARNIAVIRAVKLPTGDLNVKEISAATDSWIRTGCHLLLDADAGAAHGGSGKTLDWAAIADWADEHPDASWTLAGGLRPDNVAQAMELSGASSVDTASGVEQTRGVKSATLIDAFFHAVNSSV
ncbi:MAG: phosphoribosylanthranilate isomerase [Pirellulaceae bacterium]|nr:phosphoribosylanthranilate isomerase [Pirellulaceae bacterium]